jgi:3-methyl-2-oxobutanoate hydroxymethyltransferase
VTTDDNRPASPTGGSTALAGIRRIRVRHLQQAKDHGERWAMLTAYDAMTARVFDEAGIPVLLVGDSVATTVLGRPDTLSVTLAEIMVFARAVTGAVHRALVVVDLPFGSYESGAEQALATGVAVMKQTGATAVKLEGAGPRLPAVRALAGAGIPVMGHLGFTPQREHALGGHRVQGRDDAGVRVLTDALALQDAGAFAVVLEMVPADLAARITKELLIPVIGIGAGSGTDAQVLVWSDMAGLTPGPIPRFVRSYGTLGADLGAAAAAYARDVAAGEFPGPEHGFS